MSSNELCISWIKTLKAAWRPSKAPSRSHSITEDPTKKAEAAVRVSSGNDAPPPNTPPTGEPALEEMAFEEVMGFGDFGDDAGDGNGATNGGGAPAGGEDDSFGFS